MGRVQGNVRYRVVDVDIVFRGERLLGQTGPESGKRRGRVANGLCMSAAFDQEVPAESNLSLLGVCPTHQDTHQMIHSVLSTTKYGLVETNFCGRLTISASATQLVMRAALFRQQL